MKLQIKLQGFIFNSLFTISFLMAASPSISRAQVTCPDMNGHYQFSELFIAKADLVITQDACSSMRVQVKADVLGTTYNEDVQSPLDGVSRPAPPNTMHLPMDARLFPLGTTSSQTENDFVSGKFVGATVVFIIDRYVTDAKGNVTHTTNMTTAILNGTEKLEATLSDVNSQGQPTNTQKHEFTRVKSD